MVVQTQLMSSKVRHSTPDAHKGKRIFPNEDSILSAHDQDILRGIHQAFPLNVLPDACKPFAELFRIHRPAGVFMFFFPCLYGTFLAASLDPQITTAAVLQTTLCLLSLSVLMRGALCTWNDIIDQDLDRQVARTRIRPLARKAISTPAALTWNAVQAAAVVWNFSLFPRECVVHAIPWLVLHISYPFTKRVTSHPQFILGLAHSYGAVLAFPALDEPLGSDVGEVARRNAAASTCLCISIVAWTLLNDTIYAAQDAEDDVKAGIGSTVMFWGQYTRVFLRVLGLVQIGALVAIFPLIQAVSPCHGLFYSILACGATAAGLVAMVEGVDLSSPASCGWWFNTGNVILGFAMAGGFVAEFWGRYAF